MWWKMNVFVYKVISTKRKPILHVRFYSLIIKWFTPHQNVDVDQYSLATAPGLYLCARTNKRLYRDLFIYQFGKESPVLEKACPEGVPRVTING